MASAARKQRRREERTKRRLERRHPAAAAEALRGRNPEDPQTRQAREAAFDVRELARLVKREATANDGEGMLVGPLVATARVLAPELVARWGLQGEEHRVAAENFVVERLMAVLEDLAAQDAVAEYAAWRRECVVRVARETAA